MWRQLTASEKAKLLGQSAMGAGMTVLALALVYSVFQASVMWQLMPEVLVQLEKTSEKVQPTLHEIEAIRSLIPSILKEVKATRELVPPVLAEVKAVREMLPPLVSTGVTAIKEASGAVHAIEPHIAPVLAEVKKTREALPVIIDQTDKVVGRASEVAVQGVFGGIITAPFKLIGDAGKGIFVAMGLSDQSGFTAEDERLAGMATQNVIKAGKAGSKQTWRNSESKNSGSVALAEETTRDGKHCFALHHHVEFVGKNTHESDIDMCQQSDGSWVEVKY